MFHQISRTVINDDMESERTADVTEKTSTAQQKSGTQGTQETEVVLTTDEEETEDGEIKMIRKSK